MEKLYAFMTRGATVPGVARLVGAAVSSLISLVLERMRYACQHRQRAFDHRTLHTVEVQFTGR
jgi:hypothetical protein